MTFARSDQNIVEWLHDPEQQKESVSMGSFRYELEALLNNHGLENDSNVPDWILAEAICEFLDALNHAIQRRDRWFSQGAKGATPETPPAPGDHE